MKAVAPNWHLDQPRMAVISWTPQSANRLQRTHWAQRRKEDTALWWLVFIALGRGPWPKPFGRRKLPKAMEGNRIPGQKAKLWITVERPRLLDTDNSVAGCKSLIDCIKKTGWLVDDSPKWMDLVVTQVKSKANVTRIELTYEEPTE